MFLVRSAFWLSVVILLLPAENEKNNTDLSSIQPKVTAGQAFVAAQTTVDDLSGFCLRNQSACDTGKAAIDVFVRKAQYGAGLLNEWVSGVSSAHASPVKPVEQSSFLVPSRVELIKSASKYGRSIQMAGNSRASQHTLTKDDLAPVWGGPKIKARA